MSLQFSSYFRGICLSLIALHTANAELRVISDLGGESALRFYEPIQPVHTPDAPVHPNAIPSQVSEADMLPVVSHKLSVGTVASQPLNLVGIAPLFLLGEDDFSQAWLVQNQTRLAEMGAMGLVINVSSLESLQHLRSLAPNLQLMPAPADSLAERLGINRYPIIINAEGITQ